MTDKRLGRYQLLGVLGKGAMGIVYEAIDPHLDRRVAIKTMRLSDASSEQATLFERRFLTEARSAARLRHPGIVSVFDWGRDGDVTYLVMEKIKGVNLRQCLDKGVRFSVWGVVTILRQVLAALAHAHEQKVVHRDIKPENILLDAAGSVRLTDFGIAKIQDGADNGTLVSGMVIGTPRYMSPEQVQGKEVDARSDLFAAGVLLYELLTGRPPFNGDHDMAVISAILQDHPMPLVAKGVELSPVWDELLSKALAKQVDDRFQRAEAFRAALDQAAASEPGLSSGPGSRRSEPQLAELLQPGSSDALDHLFSGLSEHPSAPAVVDPTVATNSPAGDVPLSRDPPTLQKAWPSASDKQPPSSGRKIALALAVAALGVAGWFVIRAAVEPGEHAGVATVARPVADEAARAQTGRGTLSDAPPLPAQVPAPVTPPAHEPEKAIDLTPSVASVPTVASPVPVAGVPGSSGKFKAPSPAPVVPVLAGKPKDPLPATLTDKPAIVQGVAGPVPAVANAGKCSRLLEKASAGEPLSDSEQKEMVSSCR